MTNPVPGYEVKTPYRATGSSWWACGWHTGVDIPAPLDTVVVAARSGVVRHRDYGSAFGNRQFAIVTSDGGEDFYAHTNTRPAHGTRVRIGDPVALIGQRGNTTGPHLHFERHALAGRWTCSNMRNPITSIEEDSVSWMRYSGKPSGNLRLRADGRYVTLDARVPPPPRGGTREDRMVYLNVEPAWVLPMGDPMYSFQTASLRVRWTRDGEKPDRTAYQDFTITPWRKSFLLTHQHFEVGEKGRGGEWSMSLLGHVSTALVGTRYSKTVVE